jgi:CspA family cold shock protein
MSEVFHGTVVWFDVKKGYGFIEWSKDGVKQKDLFCHYSDVVAEGFKTLAKGQKVSFGIGLNKRDQPKAIEIKVA